MADTSSGRERSRAKKPTKKNARDKDALASDGVLANLPRTRPQRSSARRDAARRTVSAAAGEPTGAPARKQRPTASAKAQPTATSKAQPTPSAAGRKPRPTAAKAQAATTPASKQTVAKKRPAKAKEKTSATATAERFQDPAPRQGFETERDPVSGPVQPPGGVDLLSSAAELAGELTKSGLSTGGRLLKDVFARLPLN
jgi:hypothetical protein